MAPRCVQTLPKQSLAGGAGVECRGTGLSPAAGPPREGIGVVSGSPGLAVCPAWRLARCEAWVVGRWEEHLPDPQAFLHDPACRGAPVPRGKRVAALWGMVILMTPCPQEEATPVGADSGPLPMSAGERGCPHGTEDVVRLLQVQQHGVRAHEGATGQGPRGDGRQPRVYWGHVPLRD